MIGKLQRLAETNLESRPSYVEATLMRCAREVIVIGTTMCDANLAAESVPVGQGAANSNIRVAEWVNTLESLRWDQRHSDCSGTVFSADEAHTVVTSTASAQRALQEREAVDAVMGEPDDDLDTDLAKAALETGTKAFEAQEWEEADSLLQEALRVLHQLPKQQRAFCDIFGLHYKLAVCAYHTQEPADAEEALMSLLQHSASSDERREYAHDATHLLSYLYVRVGQVDRARSECEKALQARRRLLGKQSDASLESTALMAHIYMLLNNSARAKSCLAMIPEARRDYFQKIVEISLATKVKHRDLSSPPTRSISEESDLVEKCSQSRPSASPLALPMENHCYGTISAMIPQSPFINVRQAGQCVTSEKVGLEDLRSVTVTSLSSAEGRCESRDMGKERANESYSAYPGPFRAAALSLAKLPEADENFKARTLSRKEILANIGCSPKDGLEDAVCDGDYTAFAKLLKSRKSFWRSKLRKRVRPERVTALHFAALFGEINMARCLLGSSFNINEVPYGYTTSLTPLKFAIGARQVDMVEFLLANGAKPSEPDSWSTLAGQLMNRSWLKKTMSEAEKEFVPNQITAILKTLLKHGWDVNAPFEPTGRRVLHQAVGFWTGSYVWDLNLRAVTTSFLCEQGADPFRADTAGKTPYDMALASGHQDLLLVLGRGLKVKEQEDGPAKPVELPS